MEAWLWFIGIMLVVGVALFSLFWWLAGKEKRGGRGRDTLGSGAETEMHRKNAGNNANQTWFGWA